MLLSSISLIYLGTSPKKNTYGCLYGTLSASAGTSAKRYKMLNGYTVTMAIELYSGRERNRHHTRWVTPEIRAPERFLRQAPPPAAAPMPRVEPRAAEGSERVAKDFWKRMDALFDRTMRIAEQSYRTNQTINLIIVAVGVALVVNSIVYTWAKQSWDAWSIISGGMGIGSFVAIFFISPQANITKALGNLAQIQMVYKSHSLEFEAVSDYNYERFKRGGRDIEEIGQMNRELEKAAENALRMVQKYVEETLQKEAQAEHPKTAEK